MESLDLDLETAMASVSEYSLPPSVIDLDDALVEAFGENMVGLQTWKECSVYSLPPSETDVDATLEQFGARLEAKLKAKLTQEWAEREERTAASLMTAKEDLGTWEDLSDYEMPPSETEVEMPFKLMVGEVAVTDSLECLAKLSNSMPHPAYFYGDQYLAPSDPIALSLKSDVQLDIAHNAESASEIAGN